MAKSIRIKALTGGGQQIPFQEDQDIFVNPRSGKFYVNAIAQDELEYDGRPVGAEDDGIDGEAVNAVGICENCGNAVDSHINGVCRARDVTCFECMGRVRSARKRLRRWRHRRKSDLRRKARGERKRTKE